MPVESTKAPLELVIKSSPETVVAVACAECGVVFTGSTFGGGTLGLEAALQMAQSHCGTKVCACGADIQRKYWSVCDACITKQETTKEERAFEKAGKFTIDDYPGDKPIFHGDTFSDNLDEFLERYEEDGLDLPAYVWGAKRIDFHVDADNVIEQALDGHHEEANEHLKPDAYKTLQLALDTWCEEQNIRSWEPDYELAVLLKSAE